MPGRHEERHERRRKLGVDNVVFASWCNVHGHATREDIDETFDSDSSNPYTSYEDRFLPGVREARLE
jgi:hypothetical protein